MATTMLSILGIVFLLLILGGIIVLFIFWRKIKGAVYQAIQEASSSSGASQTIHLNEVDNRDWLTTEPAKDLLRLLKGRGYTEGKVYEVSEIASVYVLAMGNAKNGALGSIYHHDTLGTWIEMSAQTEQGYISYSNSIHQAFDRRPEWLDMQYLTDRSPAELLDLFEKRISSETIIPHTADEFRDFSEANYKKLMKWRNESGGLTFEEVRMQNEKMEKPLDEEALHRGYIAVKISEFKSWDIAMHEELQTNPELEYINQPIFIVPDNAFCEAFAAYLEGHMELSDQQWEAVKGLARNRMDCGAFFNEITDRLSANLRPKEYCRIEFPLNARVFIENDLEINALEKVDG